MCPLMTMVVLLLSNGERPLNKDGRTDRDTAQTIITRAIQAHGGEAKLARLKALHMKTKGSAEISDVSMTYTADSVIRLPDRYRVKIVYQGWSDPFIWVFDGKKAWKKSPGSEVCELE